MIFRSFTLSLLAGLATGIGSLPILLSPQLINKFQCLLMGFSAGVMLAATIFSLLIPSIQAAIFLGYSAYIAIIIIIVGIFIGWSFLWIVELYFSRWLNLKPEQTPQLHTVNQIWLFIIAITFHNFPEGLIVGVGVSSENFSGDFGLVLGISLQNIPEGLVVALSLKTLNYPAPYAIAASFLTGLVEPIGSLVGTSLITSNQFILPCSMAFAAGTMLFVLVNEILPNIYRNSSIENIMAVITGSIIMTAIDVLGTL
jgi:zinc transporter, ZIP family